MATNYLKKELYDLIKKDESIFDFLQEGSLDGLWYWDLEDSENIWMNPRFWKILGYNPQEMPHKTSAWQEIIHPEHLKIALDNLEKHVANANHPYDQEVRYTHKNGSTVWIRCRGMAIRNKEGKAIRMIGVHQDITSLKQTEKTLLLEHQLLKESEEKYKAMYNNAPLAFQSLDIEGNIIEANPQWLSILEYNKDEVIGHWFGDFLHPDFVEHFRTNFPRFKKQGYINNVQFQMKKKSGEYTYVSFEGCIGYTPEGKFKQTYCTFKDITKEKAAEQQHIKSEEKYRQLAKETANNLNNLKAATNITTIFLDRDLTVFEFSPGDHMEGHLEGNKSFSFKEIASHYRINEIDKLCKKVLNSLVAIELEVTCTHDMVWWMRISPYKTLENKIDGLIITFTDITEKRQLDNEVRLLSDALEKSIDAYDIVDETGRFVYANSSYLKMWGYDNLNEVIGSSPSGHCADPEMPAKITQEVMQHGKAEMEFKALRKDGSTFDVLMSVTKYIDKDGKIYFPSFSKDITEKKKQEAELEQYRNQLEELVEQKNKELVESEKRLKEAQEIAAIGNYEHNIETDEKWWSKELYHILEFDANEAPPSIEEFSKRLDDENIENLNRHMQKTISSGEMETLTYKIYMPSSDSYKYINSRAELYIDKHSGERYLRGTLQDVTERIERENELRHQKDLFERVINSVPSFIFWKDRDLNYLGCNTTFAHFAGLEEASDIIGKNDDDMAWKTEAEKFKADDQQVIDKKTEKHNYEESVLDQSGNRHLLRTHKMPLTDSSGETIGIIATCEDITEEKRAEKKLFNSEKKYRNLVENMQDMVYRYEFYPTPKFTYVSPNSTEIVGYTPQEHYDNPELGIKIIHPNDRPAFEKYMAEDLASNKLFQYRWITKNGNTVWIEQKNNPIYDDSGRIIAIEGISRNINERIEAEKQIKESEKKFRELYNQSPIAIQYYDAKGNLLDVNKKTLELYGIDSVNEIAAYNFWQSNKLSDENINDLNNGKPIFINEIFDFEAIKKHGYFKTPKKGILFVELLVAPIINNNKTVAFLVHMTDVTEKTLATDKLKASEAKFRAVFEDTNIGMALGSPDGNVIEVNEEYLNILGYSRDEFINLNYASITHPDDLEKEIPLFEQLHKGEINHYRLEKRLLAKNGEYRWIDAAISTRRDKDGNTDLTIALVIDIHEGKRANEIVSVFFEQAMNIHLICTIEGKVLRVNEGWNAILGYAKEEVIDKNIFDFIHPDDAAPTTNELKDLKKGKRTYYFENRYQHKNGHYVSLAWSAIYNTSGKLLHAIAKDITQQKAYHEQLLQSEERYKALSENAKHIILTHRFDGTITYVNKYGLDFINLPEEQIIGLNIKQLVEKETIEDLLLRVSEFEKGLFQTHQFEINFKLATGEVKTLEVIGSPFKLSNTENSILLSAYDITERKYAENKIKQQNEKYEALNEELRQTNDELLSTIEREQGVKDRFILATDSANIGVWDLDLINNKLTWDKRMFQLYGIEEDTFGGAYETWKNGVHPDDIQRADEEVQQAIEGKKEFDSEFRIVWPNKEIRYLRAYAKVVFSNKGTALRMTGVNYDITDSKQADKKLRESEEKLRLAIDNSPLGITMNDMKGNFISVNKTYEEIVGYTKDELLKMSFFDITHPDYRTSNHKLFDAMAQSKSPGFAIDKKYIHKNGKLIDVRIHAGSIHNENGEVLFGMAFTEDITERVALERQAKMLSKAVESSPVGIIITDIEGIIEYVNPFFTNMTDYTSEEAIGKKTSILKSGQQTDSYYKKLWDTILKGNTWTGEFHNKKKNGELFWENAAISPILNDKGEITQFIAVKEDITQIKRNLDELEKAKIKAEEANALKTEFLHNMSHEIRTPMNGIMGFSNLLSEMDSCNELQKNYSTIIKNSSIQLLSIIDDILEISTLETKQLTVQEKEFDVNQFMTELFAIYDLKSKERNLPLYLKKGLSNAQSYIISDKAKLHKILSNLIDNAFKFTSAGKIEFGYYIQDSNIVFFVSDTGIGISKDKQERVFHRFSQESSKTAQEYGGLGLGLSIAKENSELLGGHISLESEKGKGTSFYIQIPLKSSQNIEDLEYAIEEKTKTKEDQIDILIAEDEEVNYLFLEAILESYSDKKVILHHVINGQQAIDKCLSDENIDIVLMDIKMPVMNGYIAAEKIKAEKPELPIIAQTAYSTSTERDLALSHGCDDFVSKPINKEELFQMIDRFLEK